MEDLGAESTEPPFEALEEEMVGFWFFKEKVSKHLENLELGLKYLKAKAETAEDKGTSGTSDRTDGGAISLRNAIFNRMCAFGSNWTRILFFMYKERARRDSRGPLLSSDRREGKPSSSLLSTLRYTLNAKKRTSAS